MSWTTITRWDIVTSNVANVFVPSAKCVRAAWKEKSKFNFSEIVLGKFETKSERIEKRFDESEEAEKVLVEMEKKKIEILEKISADTRKLTNAFIDHLNKK